MGDLFKKKTNSEMISLAPKNVFELKKGCLIHTLYETVRHSLKLTEFINFGCNFNESGQCDRHRLDTESDSVMCCCILCHKMEGYISKGLPILHEDVELYESLFEDKIGFWRPEKGCALPRELRSPVCAFYMCWTLADENRPLYDTLNSCRESCNNIIGYIKELIREGQLDETLTPPKRNI